MAEQYFAADPSCESNQKPCAFVYRGRAVSCMTDAGVFSRGELDDGTRLLLDALPPLYGEVLDLGCGWGAVGIAVKKAYPDVHVTMADVNRRALDLCRFNAVRNGITAECVESDGLSALTGQQFDFIITNPPIRAGKAIVYRMLRESAVALADKGALYVVIRKQQGAESCMKYLRTLFRSVEKIAKSGGFWVLRAVQPESKITAQEESPDAHV